MKRPEALPEKQIVPVPNQQLKPSVQLSRTSADSPTYVQKFQEVYRDLQRMNQSGELVGEYKIKAGDFKLIVRGNFTCEQNNPLGSALIIVGTLSIECEGSVDLRHLRIRVIDPKQPGFALGKISITATKNFNLQDSFVNAKFSFEAGNDASLHYNSSMSKDFFAPQGFYQKKGYILSSTALEQQAPSLPSYFEPQAQPVIPEIAEPLNTEVGAHKELPVDFC